jgi:error-prone DNA polymerase
MKCWHPDVFCAALLNAQPMGFYAPAQIVRCAREHGVEAREADVNLSLWDCTLEPICPTLPRETSFALRLGLRQIDGLREADIQRLVSIRDGLPSESLPHLFAPQPVPNSIPPLDGEGGSA